jgi:DNA repair protein RecN (Recombination protein N)
VLNLLTIRNFALIENLEMEPAPGFTVLTGETGAGKSIILSALNLLLGGKAAVDLIRQGEEQAQVEAVFSLPAAVLEDDGGDGDDTVMTAGDEILLARTVSRQGRNRVQVNGGLSTLNLLAQASSRLVSLCGQHQQQTLLLPQQHLLLLDSFACLGDLRSQAGDLVKQIFALGEDIKRIKDSLERREERRAWLLAQVQELTEANISLQEEQALQEEQRLLANSAMRADLSQQAYYLLYGAEKGTAVKAVKKAKDLAEELTALDPRMEALTKALNDSYYALEDVSRQLRDYGGKVSHDPERLNWIEERLNFWQRLARRHGGSLEEALKFLRSARQELASLESGQEELAEMLAGREKLVAEAGALAIRLSQARRRAAPDFAARVVEELQDLGMQSCQFEVRMTPPQGRVLAAAQGPLSRYGLEGVEFFLAPNPGEGFHPLSRTASGGELSRLLLALRAVTARKAASPTLIFDEVDAGIGGDVGMAVGRKLARLAQDAQIICITHLPQIAAFAHCHFKVSKQVQDNRTSSYLTRLDDDARLEELARMLGTGGSALAHARRLREVAGREATLCP